MSFSGNYTDHLQPEKLDALSISIFIDSLFDARGGVGANIAYSLALLGEQPILLGSVGRDAGLYMKDLAETGVIITHIHESDLPTSSFNVLTDSSQNQVGGFYPGAMFDSDSLGLAPWKDSNPLVVVSPHDPKAMRRQVAECQKWGLRLCYDIGQQVSNLPAEDISAGLDTAEILILNEYELSVVSSKTGRSLEAIKKQIPIVVTTLGKDGSILEGKSVPRPIRVGVAPPQQVADPTGAGDAFRAGFLYGFVRGWALQTCAQLGAVCGTYAIEQAGTQTHVFTPEQITARYTQTFKQPLPGVLRKE